MENQSSPSNGRPDRALRITTIVNFVPALALLIPSGVVTAKPLPAIGLVPMAMSLVVSMAALTSNKSSVRMRPTADTIVALSLMTVMIFRFVWILLRRANYLSVHLSNARLTRSIYHFSWITLAGNYWLSSGSAMLCAYGITPMMVNLYVNRPIDRSTYPPQQNHLPFITITTRLTLPPTSQLHPHLSRPPLPTLPLRTPPLPKLQPHPILRLPPLASPRSPTHQRR